MPKYEVTLTDSDPEFYEAEVAYLSGGALVLSEGMPENIVAVFAPGCWASVRKSSEK